jgi:hypothetical protein
MNIWRWSFAVLSFLLVAPAACTGDEADCVDLCEEAQDANCTSVTGSCSSFCESLFNVEEDAGCDDERDEYQSCLNDDDVCADRCDALETDLTNCLTPYCATRTNEPDCQVLIGSFQ